MEIRERSSEASSGISVNMNEQRLQEVEQSPAVMMLKGSAGPRSRRRSRIFQEHEEAPKAKS